MCSHTCCPSSCLPVAWRESRLAIAALPTNDLDSWQRQFVECGNKSLAAIGREFDFMFA